MGNCLHKKRRFPGQDTEEPGHTDNWQNAMSAVMQSVHMADDLDSLATKILEWLTEDGQGIQKYLPQVFSKMVAQASRLIGSTHYLQITQKMADICQKFERGPQEGPLKCLVEQMENYHDMMALCEHQEKLLPLIQVLLKAEKSSHLRTRCLRALLLNAQYEPRGRRGALNEREDERMQWMEGKRLQWREGRRLQWRMELMATIGRLLVGGADPTWIPENDIDGSAVYNFFQRIPLILAHDNSLLVALLSLLPRFLTEQYLNYREPGGEGSVLHALVDYDWNDLPEDLPGEFSEQYRQIICMVVEAKPALLDMTDSCGRNPLQCFMCGITKHKDLVVNDIVPTLSTKNRVNTQDVTGQTVLHILAQKVLQTGHEAFLKIFRSLELTSLGDIQDKDGQTVLHILTGVAFQHPELGSGLLTIFRLLTTERNVNLSDNDSVPPLSWIIVTKARWGNSERDREIISGIEEIFLSRGADVERAKGQALTKPIYRWAGQELSDKGSTSNRLQLLLSGMKSMLVEKSLSYMREFKKEVWKNLWSIKNAKCIPPVMDILRILVADQTTAQHAWTSMMRCSRDDDTGRMKEMKFSVIEIMCLCAERGAKPTDWELQEILDRTDAMTRNEDLTVAFLQTLVALHRNKHFTCHLQFLGDFYIISQKMLELGKRLMLAVYKTLETCLKSKKLIDILLFISNEHEEKEILIEDSSCENWLNRSQLHLAVIILRSKKALNCLPQTIVTKYITAQDLHGCTPLHLAYLHDNKEAVQFLIAHGAMQDVTDKFKMSPKSLERTTDNNPDAQYKELCLSVLEANYGIKTQIETMLVILGDAMKALSDEVKTIQERLVKGTPLESAEVGMVGSMREKLKAGRLDEVDFQLHFKAERLSRSKILLMGDDWKYLDFLKKLSGCLKNRLAKIDWGGSDLRPISFHGPWPFLREGVTVSFDMVIIMEYEEEIPEEDREFGYITQDEAHRLQGELLGGERPVHRRMEYCTLETWTYKEFKPTYFEYEMDMIDSFPASRRLAIIIAKTLLQSFDLCRGDRLRVKMPITSYMIKTALFYILAYNYSSQLQFNKTGAYERASAEALRNALGHVERTRSDAIRASRLEYNPHPRQLTVKDVDQHGEEARVWGSKIFTLIKCLTQERDEIYAPFGWKLKSYWDRWEPVVAVGSYEYESFGEAECICDICDCALKRLDPNTFHGNGL